MGAFVLAGFHFLPLTAARNATCRCGRACRPPRRIPFLPRTGRGKKRSRLFAPCAAQNTCFSCQIGLFLQALRGALLCLLCSFEISARSSPATNTIPFTRTLTSTPRTASFARSAKIFRSRRTRPSTRAICSAIPALSTRITTSTRSSPATCRRYRTWSCLTGSGRSMRSGKTSMRT